MCATPLMFAECTLLASACARRLASALAAAVLPSGVLLPITCASTCRQVMRCLFVPQFMRCVSSQILVEHVPQAMRRL